MKTLFPTSFTLFYISLLHHIPIWISHFWKSHIHVNSAFPCSMWKRAHFFIMLLFLIFLISYQKFIWNKNTVVILVQIYLTAITELLLILDSSHWDANIHVKTVFPIRSQTCMGIVCFPHWEADIHKKTLFSPLGCRYSW